MKRKFLISFFMIVCAFCLAVGFSACNGCSNQGDDGNDDGSSHTHTAQDFVIENEVAATCTEDGSCDAVVYCSVCGEEMGRETITIAATGHTWDGGEVTAEAACTEAGTMSYTCTVCGETKTEEIAALGHDYVCEETIEPTYTATGLYTYTCSRCGDSYTKEIAVLGHTHEYESRVTKEAACTEDGVLTYTCSLCDDSYTEVIPATGHTQSAAVVERESSATCTENGSYAIVVYCSVCGEEISRETITVSATGHTVGETQTQNYVAATCTASGSYESVVYCSICGEEISRKTIRILASGHTLEYVEAQAPTCTEIGWNAYEYCTVCGYTTYEEVSATGHSLEYVEAQAPTCTEIGWNAYEYCTVCGYTTYEEIPATGHTEAEAVTENYTAATCTETGSYDSVVYCSVCNTELSRETIEISANGHTLVQVEAQAATCTEIGWNAYEYCTVCGYTTYEEIPATGHTEAEAVTENYTAATCTEAGSYDSVVYCSLCNTELSRETIEISANGHTLVQVEAQAATCTEIGWNAYEYCTVCGYTTYEEIPATGHTAGEAVKENEVAATCTEAGSYDSVVYCSVCNTELGRETIEIPANGHSFEQVEAQAPTCTEIGWNAYEYCIVCGYTTYEEVSATGHSLVHVDAQAATCTEIGWNAYEYCTVCGYNTYEEIPATGHTEAEAVTESYTAATCTEAGSYDSVVYCSVCNIELSRETIVIPANGHTLVQVDAQAATCTEIGWNAYEYCTVCGYTTYEEIPATGHTEAEAVTENYTAATCTEAGSYDSVVYCSLCNTELSRETIEIPATGHTTITKIENAVASTCTQEGSYDRVVYCSVCEVEISRTTKTIDKKEHFEGSPVTENEVAATCTVDGSYDTVIYCKTCAAELSRVTTAVSATGHTWNSGVVTTAATATSSGVMTYTCINCGETRTEIIPAKGTDDSVYTRVDADGNEDADGDYIYFGSYPQTEVTDSAITAELTALAGELPTSTDSCNWTSYGYYIGTDRVSTQSNSTDYMWYIDITYSGVTYRGVYFTSYRPYGTYYSSSESNSNQDDNGYYINSLYWFEYEPILWRILEEETSGGETYATILCEMLIDSQAYQNCYVYSGGYYYAADDSGTILTDSSGNKVYANNYAYSTIREWLNDTFYNTAFNQLEQALIQLVTVDNSAGTTSSSTNLYACGDTEDYVWLLSYQDVVNASYGFNSSASTYDKARQKKTTDYAKSQGASTSTSTNINSRGNGDWWVRSPYSENSYYAGYVYCHGYTGNLIVNVTYRSVCPALKIKLS